MLLIVIDIMKGCKMLSTTDELGVFDIHLKRCLEYLSFSKKEKKAKCRKIKYAHISCVSKPIARRS